MASSDGKFFSNLYVRPDLSGALDSAAYYARPVVLNAAKRVADDLADHYSRDGLRGLGDYGSDVMQWYEDHPILTGLGAIGLATAIYRAFYAKKGK